MIQQLLLGLSSLHFIKDSLTVTTSHPHLYHVASQGHESPTTLLLNPLCHSIGAHPFPSNISDEGHLSFYTHHSSRKPQQNLLNVVFLPALHHEASYHRSTMEPCSTLRKDPYHLRSIRGATASVPLSVMMQ